MSTFSPFIRTCILSLLDETHSRLYLDAETRCISRYKDKRAETQLQFIASVVAYVTVFRSLALSRGVYSLDVSYVR
jgi:hypothetical protein